MIWLWLLLTGLAVFLVHQLWYKRLKYPKGPMPWPVVGNMLSFKGMDRWEDKLVEWKKQYGDIYTYWLGPFPVITVNDYKKAVEMFVKDGDSYIDKFVSSNVNFRIRGGKFGIIDTSGDEWRTQRRFALKILRDFGLGKNVMQDQILEEVQTVCENVNKLLEKDADAEIDFQKYTDLAIGSVINNIVCGYRFTTNGREKEYYEVREALNRMINIKITPLLVLAGFLDSYGINFSPIARHYKDLLDDIGQLFNFVVKAADEHIKTTDYTQMSEPRDVIDAYMIAALQSEQETGKNLHYTINHLRNTAADLWLAGLETVAGTVSWAFAYLIVYSNVQQKLHEELDRVVGSDRLITLADRPSLPYTCAFIMEVQRCANIITMNLLKMTSRDVVINGKDVAKGTICIAQISTIMMDETVFKDPKRFNPSRFINSEGNFEPKDEVIPFSIGKRACLGESLARMELFLFISNLANQYKFFAGNEQTLLMKFPHGGQPTIKPYLCRIKRRF